MDVKANGEEKWPAAFTLTDGTETKDWRRAVLRTKLKSPDLRIRASHKDTLAEP